MAAPSLARIDVNLLVALDVLLEERNVTRAAKRLAVTQSAMSQTLQRLRGVFDDPLLVRRGLGMAPTPRAEALAGPLRVALRQLERVVIEAPTFEPARARRTFRLALYDVYAVSVLPQVIARLARDAPEVELDVLPVEADTIEERLARGEVDVAVLRTKTFPSDLAHERVLEERLVTMLRRDHPALANGTPSAEVLARHPHAMIRLSGRGSSEVDTRLSSKGLSRRVRVRQPYFLAAAAIACESDLVLSLAASVAHALAERWPVVVIEPPYGRFDYAVGPTWSRHLDAEPGHRWFREVVADAMRALAARAEVASPGSASSKAASSKAASSKAASSKASSSKASSKAASSKAASSKAASSKAASSKAASKPASSKPASKAATSKSSSRRRTS